MYTTNFPTVSTTQQWHQIFKVSEYENTEIDHVELTIMDDNMYGRMVLIIEIFPRNLLHAFTIKEPVSIDLWMSLSGKQLIHEIYHLFMMPLSDMPLHINDECSIFKKIAEWRLKTGF